MTENQSYVQLATLLFIIGVTLIVIAYDIVIMKMWGGGATVSQTFQRIFRWCPICEPLLWFFLGLFCGHVFLRCE